MKDEEFYRMVRILTDSTSDISQALGTQMGISVIPLHVIFGDEALREGVEITMDQFYERLISSKELPTTSQPAPDDFLPYFQQAAQAGDEMVVLLLSSTLSGTVQSAGIAREMAGYDRIHIIDSLTTTTGLRLLVDMAVRLRDEGKDAATIVRTLEEMKQRVIVLAMVNTLEYLCKGGRLSTAGKIAGTLLNMKPVVELSLGTMGVRGKARGVAAGIGKMLDEVQTIGVMDPIAPVYFGYTYVDDKCRLCIPKAEARFEVENAVICPVGCVIGTHLGPGACLMTFLRRE